MNNILPNLDMDFIVDRLEKKLFTKEQQSELFMMIAAPLNAGVQLSDIANHIFIYGNKIQKRIAQNLLDLLERGAKISPAFDGYYDELTLTALQAGEEAGLLPQTISQLSEDLGKQSSGMVIFLKAVQYPIILLSVIMPAVWALGKFFVPVVSKGAKGIPSDLILLGDVSKIYEVAALPFIVLCIMSFVGFSNIAKSYTGEHREALDNFPFFKFYKSASGTAFIRAYSMLRRNKLLPANCLESLYDNGTPYIRYHVSVMLTMLRSGKDEVDALNVGLLSNERISTLYLYATTQEGFVQSLTNSAQSLVSLQLETIKKMGNRTRISLIIFTVVNIAWLALAVVSVSDITYT